jgi:hypothetical protein
VGTRTGNPRGRPKGAKNKRTQEREAATQEAARKLEAVIPNAFQGDSHAFLVSVYKDPAHPIERRLDAAKAAIPYERPRLSTTELNGTVGIKTHEEALRELIKAVDKSQGEMVSVSEEPSPVRH